MNKPTRSRLQSKPPKPYDGFPLFPHASGRWAKKIRGKLHYFGWWTGQQTIPWQTALEKYQAVRDDLHAGRTPRVPGEGLTLRDLVNRYLTVKRHLLDSRELSPRTFGDYYEICAVLITQFGRERLVSDLAADDFERLRATLGERWGPARVSNVIKVIKGVFKYGYESGLLSQPMLYGPAFKRPSKKVLRAVRAAAGPRLFTTAEIHKLLAAVSPQVKAMILLGLNCGYGNSDCASLPLGALDLDGGWVNFPRPKTAIPRRCPLWPETVEALREALLSRPGPKNPADEQLVFITKYGMRWVKAAATASLDGDGNPQVRATRDDALGKEMRRALHALGINGRAGLGFYTLRHTFRTVADEARDQPAADLIMGHESQHMSNIYRERVSDERLRAVTDHVGAWLFAAPASQPAPASWEGGSTAAFVEAKSGARARSHAEAGGRCS
jgi:integrase